MKPETQKTNTQANKPSCDMVVVAVLNGDLKDAESLAKARAQYASLRNALETIEEMANGDCRAALKPFHEVDVMTLHARHANASIAQGAILTLAAVAHKALAF